jgi:hypothetical protein
MIIKFTSLTSVWRRDTGTEKLISIFCAMNFELTGTMPYVSINDHLGMKQLCHDDLESIAYILKYFLHGSLPWNRVKLALNKQQ